MADRRAFLEHIREQAAKGRAYRVAINPEATHTQSYVGGGTDLVASLLSEWRAVGGEGDRVSGLMGIQEYLRSFFQKHGTQRVLHWKHPVIDRVGLSAICRELNIETADWSALAAGDASSRWEKAFAADLGVTSVDWAIAETGSLALFSQPDQGRVVSLLPKRYLAIVERNQIIPDLFDLFEKLEARKTDLPSNMVLVTGPSKTGDIELKLTTGVHGPGNVHLLVVE